MTPAFCRKCGHSLLPDDAFCRGCGTVVTPRREPEGPFTAGEEPPENQTRPDTNMEAPAAEAGPVPATVEPAIAGPGTATVSPEQVAVPASVAESAPVPTPPVIVPAVSLPPAPVAPPVVAPAAEPRTAGDGGDGGSGRSRSGWWLGGGAVVAVAVAAIVLVASGALSSKARHRDHRPKAGNAVRQLVTATAPKGTSTAGTTTSTSPVDTAVAKQAVVNVLTAYATDYTHHSSSGLASIFSPGISRRGLAAAGCTVSHGRAAVLADYQAQFNEGTGAYQLVGLSPLQVVLSGSDSASVQATYRIAPGGTGRVAFRLSMATGRWLIVNVTATCS